MRVSLRIPSMVCLVAILCSSLSACTSSSALDCTRKDILCAALVTDTQGLNDYGLNHDTWEGLTQAKADGVVDQIASIESTDVRDYEKNIGYFVRLGYDVIVTTGAGLRTSTLRSADLFPDSVFIGMNQTDDKSRSNFIPITFPEDQMGFFAGALAAHLTKTRIIGAVCETSGIDAMWRYCEGFRAGARYTDESVKVMVTYRDDGSRSDLFIDEKWGRENAQKLIQDGADILFAVGGDTGMGALRAAAEAGVRTIGAERDQGAALGDQGSSVITSVLGRANLTVEEVLRNIRNGKLTDPGINPIGCVSLDSVLPKDLVDEMNQLLVGLANGEIKTGVLAKKP